MRIAYSCAVDRTAKLYWEALVWMAALTGIAKVAPQDLFVHLLPGVDADMRAAIAAQGCRLLHITPLHPRHPRSNKLQQLHAAAFTGYDAVAFLDADMEVLVPYDAGDVDPATIGGVPVFQARPATQSWARLLGRSDFATVPSAGSRQETYRNNLNGGLYLVPVPLIDDLGRRARGALAALLDTPGEPNAEWEEYADQIAVALALDRMGLLANILPAEKNCPPYRMAQRGPVAAIHGLAKIPTPAYHSDGRHVWPATQPKDRTEALDAAMRAANAHPLGAPFHAYRTMRRADARGDAQKAVDHAMQAARMRLGASELGTVADTLARHGRTQAAAALRARLAQA